MLILFLILLTSEMTHQVTLSADDSQCNLNKNMTSSFANDKSQLENEYILNQSYTSGSSNRTTQVQTDQNLSPKNLHYPKLYDLQLEIFYEHNTVI